MTTLSQPRSSALYTPRAKNFALVLLAMTQFVISLASFAGTDRRQVIEQWHSSVHGSTACLKTGLYPDSSNRRPATLFLDDLTVARSYGAAAG